MQVTIDLPEALQQNLINQATQNQTTPEQLILATLIQKFLPPSEPDLAENQDYDIDQPPQKYRQAGSLKGMITISPDFDEPLEDLKDYM
jgi:Protein of unknown function (DUF2281)